LSVLSEEEQKFLQCYFELRQRPKTFNSKELFSVINYSQAQKEAEDILKSFEVKEGKIICTDPSALQCLVPYVKRLLQLFPEIKILKTGFFSAKQIVVLNRRNKAHLILP
jgi:hypothetical protein